MSAEQNVVDAPVEHRQGHESAENFSGDEAGSGGQGGGYELDENGQRIPHGMGQSKSSRRRRRKRKSKGDGATGESAAAGESSGSGSSEEDSASAAEGTLPVVNAGAAPGAPRGNGNGRSFAGNGGGQPGQNGAGSASAPGGTKRWKKKFRDRDRGPRNENPGNGSGASFVQGSVHAGSNGNGSSQFRGPDTHQPGNGGGSFKRKGGSGGGGGFGGKQRSQGPRSFVGPMDHSYRVVNGNFAETPPSTIEPNGSHGGQRRGGYQSDSQPIDYSQGRPVPIAADAPTHIYFFIEDLFITAKIQETARKLGVKVAFVKNEKESIAALTSGEEADKPALIVFDLNNANAKPMTLIPKLKSKLKKSASIVGFLSHLQGDLKAKAVEAGCDTVMPRAAFSQNLPNLLRRYGIEDTDEANYNQ